MNWSLAPGVGYCETGGELVFLDLARDRYFALRGADRAAFERLRAREPNSSEDMTRLAATGLVARADQGHSLDPAHVEIPARDLAAESQNFSLSAGLSAVRALYWARRAMRPSHIAATLKRLAKAKVEIGRNDNDEMTASIAARYAASRWIAPISPRCLVDALALDHILVRRKLAATLVFGVRIHPFAAHSWLQTPQIVLTGTAAEARNFMPILVVG